MWGGLTLVGTGKGREGSSWSPSQVLMQEVAPQVCKEPYACAAREAAMQGKPKARLHCPEKQPPLKFEDQPLSMGS